ncbi:hypothetical protein K443DRAFT_685972 [Laccaria amethystina LaAM-08-1]|uniref:Uncharacterized protein n=1 Tax=Laccaria amethystina LaAM-08-1 TaxID=1095629 RepID=A0A0C9X4W7_9AGAR|nr:hypothetical protein K443DRAFT_685972 [Laccaria amethystina LaAM-08-1]
MPELRSDQGFCDYRQFFGGTSCFIHNSRTQPDLTFCRTGDDHEYFPPPIAQCCITRHQSPIFRKLSSGQIHDVDFVADIILGLKVNETYTSSTS